VIGRGALVLAALLAALTLSATAARCGEVRVGVFDFEPLVSAGEQGQSPRGVFVDLLEHIAREEGLVLRYVPGSYPKSLERLETGEIDLLVAVAHTGENAARFDFCKNTPLSTWGQLYVRQDSDIRTVLDLAAKSIAVVKDDPYAGEVRSVLKRFNIGCEFIETNGYRKSFECLQKKWVEAAVIDRIYGEQHERQYSVTESPILFSPLELRYAATRGRHRNLLETIDYHLAAMKKDENSVYHRSLSRWLGHEAEPVFPEWLKWTIAAGAVLLLISTLYGFVLKRQVLRRTRELRASEERYRETVEMLPSIVAELDGEQRLVYMNRAGLNLLGYSEGEIRSGMKALDLVFPEDRHAVKRRLQAVLSGQTTGPREVRVFARDGALHTLLYSCAAVQADGEITGVRCSAEDITDSKSMESQLRHAQRMEAVGQLAGGVAHEFNNLLMGISGYAEMAQSQVDPESRVVRDLGRIDELVQRGSALNRQLLAFSRREEGMVPVVVDLGALLRNTSKMLRRVLPESIDVDIRVAGEIDCVRADPGQIEQVVLNLAVNARDAMPEGGSFRLEVSRATLDREYAIGHPGVEPGEYVRLSVSDTGCGMDERTRERAFEPFFTTKAVGKGTGLGLAAVYGIVKQHKGYVWIYTEVGRGTTFSIYLPAVADKATTRRRRFTAPGEKPGGSETVLLAEDESQVRELVGNFLEAQGYTVISAGNPAQAREAYEANDRKVDLLLTDIVMPGGSGCDLYESLAELDPGLKVVFMSGYPDGSHSLETAREIAGVFLQKPFSLGELAVTVRRAIEGKETPAAGKSCGRGVAQPAGVAGADQAEEGNEG